VHPILKLMPVVTRNLLLRCSSQLLVQATTLYCVYLSMYVGDKRKVTDPRKFVSFLVNVNLVPPIDQATNAVPSWPSSLADQKGNKALPAREAGESYSACG
jgi:hypothetical protein